MIDLDLAKAHLRIETDDENTIVQAYLSTAIAAVQTLTGKLLAERTASQALAGFPACDKPIRLFKGPATAVVSIDYDDPAGNAQTLSSFRLVEGAMAQLLPAYGEHWPAASCAAGSVRIAYTAGYAADEVPPELDQAVLLLTAHYYANREAAIADNRAAAIELPLAVDMLLANYCAPGIA
jgi:uncharacterized phiE125 gp8 family phage protein